MATYLPYSDVVAAYGYKQPPLRRQRDNVVLLALAYVVMGGALGTVAGASLAMATFQTGIPAMTFQISPAVQASSRVENVVTPHLQTSTLRTHTAGVRSSIAKPSPLKFKNAGIQVASHHYAQPQNAPVRSMQPRTAQVSNSQPHTAQPRTAQVKIAQVERIALTTNSPKITPPSSVLVAPVPAAAPVTAVAAETVAKNYTFYSEGDATVAEFDASVGRIETYEGRTFVIGGAAAASAGDAFEDSGSSIHYRCDQSGSCTLVRGGLIMHNARLM